MASTTGRTTGVGVTNIRRMAIGKSTGNNPVPSIPPVTTSPLRYSTCVTEVVSYEIRMMPRSLTTNGNLVTYYDRLWWWNQQGWHHVHGSWNGRLIGSKRTIHFML